MRNIKIKSKSGFGAVAIIAGAAGFGLGAIYCDKSFQRQMAQASAVASFSASPLNADFCSLRQGDGVWQMGGGEYKFDVISVQDKKNQRTVYFTYYNADANIGVDKYENYKITAKCPRKTITNVYRVPR